MSAILNQTSTMIIYQYSRGWPDRKGYRNLLSPRRKVRKGVSYKNKIKIEVLSDLGAFVRNQDVKTPTQADFTVMRKSTTTVRSGLNYN